MDDSDSAGESISNPPEKIVLVDGPALSGVESYSRSTQGANPYSEDKAGVSSRPQWVWFVAGLFILPIFVAIASTSFATLADSGLFTSYSSEESTSENNVSFGTEAYAVRGFYMSSEFNSNFATHGYWDLTVETETWEGYISGYGSQKVRDIEQPVEADDTGKNWWVAEFHDANQNFSVYISQEGNSVFIAYPPSTSEPTYTHYYWKDSGGILDFGSLAVLVWPVSAIGGIAWGFAKKRPSFSYGVMIWGSIVLLATVFIAFIALAL